MSVIIIHHVYCDGGCGEPVEDTVGGQRRAVAAQRKDARERYGWVRVKWKGKMLDLCNDCKRTHESRKDPHAR
jgi:hypothetical protein